MKRVPLTEPEKLFLKVLRQMAKRQEPFTYRRVSELCGWRSTQMAFQTRQALERKGRVTLGKRFALIECPIEVAQAA